ncbi:MAG: HD domain-containing protein [Fibrobacter sp.]|nr:HD domain-containing protein [Fibrobacter sp.]
MLEIPISFLAPGQVSDQTYYSKSGEVIIKKNVVITPQFIAALKQQNIESIYAEGSSDDEELNNILFPEIDESSISDSATSTSTFLPNLQAGKEGFIELIKGSINTNLDRLISERKTEDKPSGPAYRENASRMKRSERTTTYKSDVISGYDDALAKTKTILNNLTNGQSVSTELIRNIVVKFMKLFLTDRDILLNLSLQKPNDTDYLYSHSLNTCLLSINIAAAYGYNETQITEIGMGALLHDVGMLLVPKEIRFKQSRPTEDEWFEIQKHPLLGLYLLEKIPRLPEPVSLVAYQVHERENGKGYPKQRSSRLIHNYAKVVAVADVFEALSSPRSYREANLPYKAMEMVIRMTRQGLISGEFVKALLEYSSLFPIGSIVELSNNCLAKVVQSNGTSFAKPSVCVLTDSKGNILSEEDQYTENLSENTSIQIIKAHRSNYFSNDPMLGF